jgi:hypothetical protein
MTLLILEPQLVNACEKNKMVAMKLKFSIMVHLVWMEGLGIHRRRTELHPWAITEEEIKASFSNFGHKESKEGGFCDAKWLT